MGVVLLVVARQDVLQQRPLLRARVGLKRPGVEEQEEDAFLGAVDQLAGEVEILGVLRGDEPRRDLPGIDIVGL